MVIRSGIEPPLFGFRALGESQPNRVPAVVIFNLRRHRANLVKPGRRGAIEQRPVERVDVAAATLRRAYGNRDSH
jgi:hypothetical protein